MTLNCILQRVCLNLSCNYQNLTPWKWNAEPGNEKMVHKMQLSSCRTQFLWSFVGQSLTPWKWKWSRYRDLLFSRTENWNDACPCYVTQHAIVLRLLLPSGSKIGKYGDGSHRSQIHASSMRNGQLILLVLHARYSKSEIAWLVCSCRSSHVVTWQKATLSDNVHERTMWNSSAAPLDSGAVWSLLLPYAICPGETTTTWWQPELSASPWWLMIPIDEFLFHSKREEHNEQRIRRGKNLSLWIRHFKKKKNKRKKFDKNRQGFQL